MNQLIKFRNGILLVCFFLLTGCESDPCQNFEINFVTVDKLDLNSNSFPSYFEEICQPIETPEGVDNYSPTVFSLTRLSTGSKQDGEFIADAQNNNANKLKYRMNMIRKYFLDHTLDNQFTSEDTSEFEYQTMVLDFLQQLRYPESLLLYSPNRSRSDTLNVFTDLEKAREEMKKKLVDGVDVITVFILTQDIYTTKSLPVDTNKDTDKDGVKDVDDECPEVVGPTELKGCPDSDGDGVADKYDKCPRKRGSVKTNGCPDSDKDGVYDHLDRCPGVAGSKHAFGCPDRDGDGVPDKDDKCPDESGDKKLSGCKHQKLEMTFEPSRISWNQNQGCTYNVKISGIDHFYNKELKGVQSIDISTLGISDQRKYSVLLQEYSGGKATGAELQGIFNLTARGEIDSRCKRVWK